MELVLSEHELITSEFVIRELRRTLRQKFKVPASTIAAFERLLREQVLVRQPSRPHSLPVRDPDDRWILASAEAGKVDLLVTGDKDLLDIASKVSVHIVDPRQCWRLLKGQQR